MSIDVPHQMPYFHETYETLVNESTWIKTIPWTIQRNTLRVTTEFFRHDDTIIMTSECFRIPRRDEVRGQFSRVNIESLLGETPMWFIYSKSECDATLMVRYVQKWMFIQNFFALYILHGSHLTIRYKGKTMLLIRRPLSFDKQCSCLLTSDIYCNRATIFNATLAVFDRHSFLHVCRLGRVLRNLSRPCGGCGTCSCCDSCPCCGRRPCRGCGTFEQMLHYVWGGFRFSGLTWAHYAFSFYEMSMP